MDLAIERLCALAQETRLQAFRHLVTAGPDGLAAGSLSSGLGVPPGTLSFHLKEMTHAGLIQSRRRGRQIIYAVNYAGMRELLTYLMRDCCQGQPELCVVPDMTGPRGEPLTSEENRDETSARSRQG